MPVAPTNSIVIEQTPASASLAQSPILFSVKESTTGVFASSSFQYISELYYWTGSESNSGSADYTLQKYPNTSDYGIFDFSRIINSALTDKREENESNTLFYKADFYYQYVTESQFVTSSHLESGIYKALDGYALFPENVTQSLEDKTPFFPILTDGPVSQSITQGNGGRMGVWTGDINLTGSISASHIRYTDLNETEYIALSSSLSTDGQIQQIPIGYEEADFPLSFTNIGSGYNICPVSESAEDVNVETDVSGSYRTEVLIDGGTSFTLTTLDYDNSSGFSFWNGQSPLWLYVRNQIDPGGGLDIFDFGVSPTRFALVDNINDVGDVTLAAGYSVNLSGDSFQWYLNFATAANEASQSFVSSSVESQTVFEEVGNCIRFNVDCDKKYPNVRIKWKNRFGQYDFFNFNLVSREGFSTTTRTYQPQLGSWDSAQLSYNQYDSSIANYISDSSQTLQVNTDWISEDYNEIFKQLMVSDEIYWMYDEPNGLIKPLTIKTNNIQFKTGVVDKLIQYSFDFDLGQNYKLIL